MNEKPDSDRCPLRPLSEQQREQRASDSGGQPLLELDANANPFSVYLNADTLHSLQEFRTKAPAEPSFFIVSQVQDLLFHLAYVEAAQARDQLDLDDLDGALWTMRRLKRVLNVLVATWEPLSSFSPQDFAEFRDALGEGSGFQSFMYRKLEFVLGLKKRSMADMHAKDPQVHQALREVLDAPGLYDAVLRLLHRSGLPVPDDVVNRDWAEEYRERDEVTEAWRQVYASPHHHRATFELAELLTDIAFDFGRWRTTHMLTVERLIGSKAGSGGSSGVDFLRRVADHRFFPELWAVRAGL
ncbi:tryptophan 2,3-dioxygenase [Streptomyces sp. CS149]|uniref:tryptophan 2,3-dioxygenase n=1 Tax=Streptomyces TaxID=1883 RepID=UPI000D1C0986|nr:tryptophan 2,3-dioxygenase family protein [Streptomyces sp. CS149]MCC8479046.1 tryptophan 2,3-dioxygenase family protein [Streptomyces globisporus]PSK69926.1 tryptophan 2,3-dioxygenase [Streptomyces sp. CS149]